MLADPAHREVARIAAERSAVLLRNEGGLLPLDAASLGSIAVIGPLADSRARHARALVLRLRPDETVTVAGRHPARVGARPRSSYAPGVRPAQRPFPSIFDMFGDNAPVDPEDFDDDAELPRAVELAARLRRRRRGGRRVAEHDRGAGVPLVAGAARPPARAAAGRGGDGHAGGAAGA